MGWLVKNNPHLHSRPTAGAVKKMFWQAGIGQTRLYEAVTRWRIGDDQNPRPSGVRDSSKEFLVIWRLIYAVIISQSAVLFCVGVKILGFYMCDVVLVVLLVCGALAAGVYESLEVVCGGPTTLSKDEHPYNGIIAQLTARCRRWYH